MVISSLGTNHADEISLFPEPHAHDALREYLLSLRNSTGFFAPGENLYLAVNDGEMLYATTPACEVY